MDDSISRQWLMECVEEGWIKFDTEEDENKFIHLVRDIAPPAYPSATDTNVATTDTISRQETIKSVCKMLSNCFNASEEMIESVKITVGEMPSAQSEEPSHEAVKEYCRKRCLSIVDTALLEKYLPTAQPNLSEAYSKAVFTWLMDYQIRTAELKGRYTPYEVLSWVINDWRKENG